MNCSEFWLGSVSRDVNGLHLQYRGGASIPGECGIAPEARQHVMDPQVVPVIVPSS